VKKEAKMKVETSEKNLRLFSGSSGILKWGKNPGKELKKFLKILFWKKYRKAFVFAKRPWCRRRDGYRCLRNVGKAEQRVVIRSPS